MKSIFLVTGAALAFCLWAPNVRAEDGKKIFEENCAGCHSLGGGDGVGPDLKGVVKRRSRDWTLHYISEPDEMRKVKDKFAMELRKKFPDSEMPNLGIAHEGAESLADYLGGLDMPPGAPAVPAEEKRGDIARGRALFSGALKLSAGGPACFGCHSSADMIGVAGGRLGPDLSVSAKRLGFGALKAALKGSAFPTMKPLYQGRGLTEDEQLDVATYLLDSGQEAQSVSGVSAPSFLPAFLWFAALLALTQLIWRKRFRGVRKTLVDRANRAVRAAKGEK